MKKIILGIFAILILGCLWLGISSTKHHGPITTQSGRRGG